MMVEKSRYTKQVMIEKGLLEVEWHPVSLALR